MTDEIDLCASVEINVEDIEKGDSKSYVQVYKDESGEWRFRRKSSNGQIIGKSEESFTSKSYAIERAKKDYPSDELVIE